MTERLYYTDAGCRRFEATVVACRPRRAGDGTFAVVLDRTAFYPTSGGQPFDTGTLGAARVIDVVDEDAAIVHVTDAPLCDGTRVEGAIDWGRRLDHMQQHTGQHVLSAAFDRLFDNRTESVHLGADGGTIDLAREVSAAQVADAVSEANRVVWEDRPVAVRFVSGDEAATLPLRKAPSREGRLRLVEVEDFDLSACGGTHVPRTGGIGIITVSRWERFRGGSRVEFLCGNRVRHRFDTWRDALAATMTHLSVAPGELAGAVERLQGENKALQRALREARERLAAFEARALVERGIRIGPRVVVAEVVADADAVVLKAMAAAAAREAGAAVALFGAGTPALVVTARHADAGVDAAAVLKALVARFGGKGGGRPDLAQGGGLEATPEALVSAARELLSN
jgi:alanyl-tRNA synthetase